MSCGYTLFNPEAKWFSSSLEPQGELQDNTDVLNMTPDRKVKKELHEIANNIDIKSDPPQYRKDVDVKEKQNLGFPVQVGPSGSHRRWACAVCGKTSWSPAHLRVHARVHTDERPSCCHVCGKRFRTDGNLARHMLTHTGEKPFACEYCSKRFTQKSVLIKHVRVHTGETPYSCNICHKRFARSFTLACHRRIHGDNIIEEKPVRNAPKIPENWTCEICNRIFKNKSYKHAHMQTHKRVEKFTCDACRKQFSTLENLQKHAITHLEKAEKARTCSDCGKEFKTHANLVRHMLVHTGERPFVCGYCNKGFTQKSVLVKHERIHTGETPYSCEICFKRFSRSFTLENHLKRVHKTGEVNKKKVIECDTKPFWCGNCDNWYNNEQFYKHDCVKVKELSEDNYYECDNEALDLNEEFNEIDAENQGVDDIELNTEGKLVNLVNAVEVTVKTDQELGNSTKNDSKIIEEVHTEDVIVKQPKKRKRWSCKHCKKKFKTKSYFTAHVKTHRGTKPSFCDVCNKNFNSNGNLIRHMLIHSGEKPFACDHCTKRFTQKSVLTRHASQSHRVRVRILVR